MNNQQAQEKFKSIAIATGAIVFAIAMLFSSVTLAQQSGETPRRVLDREEQANVNVFRLPHHRWSTFQRSDPSPPGMAMSR